MLQSYDKKLLHMRLGGEAAGEAANLAEEELLGRIGIQNPDVAAFGSR
jgi:hypothetical protein